MCVSVYGAYHTRVHKLQYQIHCRGPTYLFRPRNTLSPRSKGICHGPDIPSQTSKFTLPPRRGNVAVASGYALYLRRVGSWVLILHRAIYFLSNFRHVFPWPFARFFRQHGHTGVAMDWMIVVIGIHNNNTQVEKHSFSVSTLSCVVTICLQRFRFLCESVRTDIFNCL